MLSCARRIPEEGYLINIENANHESTLFYSSIFGQGKTIILEENEESLIGMINKMQVYKDTIFILDKHIAKCILLFKDDGKFIRKIGKIGNGPGECVSISDFTIDSNKNELYILDYYKQSILKFSISSGEFISSINIWNNKGSLVGELAFSNGSLYADANFVYNSSKDNFLLQKINQITGECFEFYYSVEDNKGWENADMALLSPFYFTGKRFLFSGIFMNRVIDISKEIPSTYLVFESRKFIDSKKLNELKSSDEIILDLMKTNNDYHLNTFIEYGNYLHFQYTQGNSIKFVILNINTNETILYNNIQNDYIFSTDKSSFYFPQLGYATKDGIYFYYNTRSLSDLIFALEKGIISKDIDKYNELLKLSEDSNPILFYYRFKE